MTTIQNEVIQITGIFACALAAEPSRADLDDLIGFAILIFACVQVQSLVQPTDGQQAFMTSCQISCCTN